MSKKTWGIIGMISLMVALFFECGVFFTVVLIAFWIYAMQKAGVVNWKEEINKPY